MYGSLTIRQAQLVLPDRIVTGDLVVVDGVIEQLGPHIGRTAGEEINGEGKFVIPGLIDGLALYRLTSTESTGGLAQMSGNALRDGITSQLVADPQDPTVDRETLLRHLDVLGRQCRTHFGVHLSAHRLTLHEIGEIERAASLRFSFDVGPSHQRLTLKHLEKVYATAPRLIALRGFDPKRLGRTAEADSSPIESERGQLASGGLHADMVELGLELSQKHGVPTVFDSISSRAELEAFDRWPGDHPWASLQALASHLLLDPYPLQAKLGAGLALDPPLRSQHDQEAVWKALREGKVDALAGGAYRALSQVLASPDAKPVGRLALLLREVRRGRITLLELVRWCADAPARLYNIPRKGKIEIGYDGDLVIFDGKALTEDHPTPDFNPVSMTVLRGRPAFREGVLSDGIRGKELVFNRLQPKGVSNA